LLWNLYWFL